MTKKNGEIKLVHTGRVGGRTDLDKMLVCEVKRRSEVQMCEAGSVQKVVEVEYRMH